MTHKTRLIVLRAIKYGDTSLVVTAFTELFGLQTYMVSGVRTTKKAGSKAALYQPGAVLDAVVYHHEQRNMQRIKEASWGILYRHIYEDVVKNSIAVFMMELLYKALKQPEKNEALYYFSEDVLQALDDGSAKVSANVPLFFAIHLSGFFGFKIGEPSAALLAQTPFFDLQDGTFYPEQPIHPYFLETEAARQLAELLKVMQPSELSQIQLNRQQRRALLHKLMDYYALHIQDFGQMKTLVVMEAVL